MQRLLLIGVRDETGILPALDIAGYCCRTASPDDEALSIAFESFNPDAIVLELAEDILLLHQVRRVLRSAFNARSLPVFALVRPAHLKPPQFVVGVDDFLVAPYATAELVARMQMLFWRFQRAEIGNCLRSGDLKLDIARHAVTIGDQPIPLTLREYQLLQFLMTHRGRTFTRESLLAQVWGYQFEGDVRVVDAYVKRVRSRLTAPYRSMVETIRGVGYRFAANAL
jgi:DNA-binding response OmpR family regulator